MAEVSRNTVAVLLVLVIVVSAIGTWSLIRFTGTTEYSSGYSASSEVPAGLVSLSINKIPEDHGRVALTIQPGTGSAATGTSGAVNG